MSFMKERKEDDEIKKLRKAIVSKVGTEGSNVGAGMWRINQIQGDLGDGGRSCWQRAQHSTVTWRREGACRSKDREGERGRGSTRVYIIKEEMWAS